MIWNDPERYKSSLKKWEGIVAKLEKGERVNLSTDVYGLCGFCFEAAEDAGIEPNVDLAGDTLSDACFSCLLHPRFCSNEENEGTLFWRVVRNIAEERFAEALPLAKQMLEQIKSYAPSDFNPTEVTV